MLNGISSKELYRNVINFKSSPRTLKWEWSYWGGTLDRWYKEGLPEKKGLTQKPTYGESVRGYFVDPFEKNRKGKLVLDYDVAEYFSLDRGYLFLPYKFFYFLEFEEKIVYENENYIEKYNELGIKIRTLKDESSMPMWLEYPVVDRKSWETIKRERLNVDNIMSRFDGSIDNFLKVLKEENLPVYLGDFYGFFGGLRFLMGEVKLFMTYYDDPSLIKDINKHLLNIWLAISEELISKIEFDAAYFWEDMSGKNGSLISPATFREFMTPYYSKITDFLKAKGIIKIGVDTDGDVQELIPLFLEAGVNMMFPFEQQAGNDLIQYRKKYPELVMIGGFDKNTLSKGRENIDRELEKMEWLISQGGYIPFCDHAVPPDASWENYKYYRQKLNNIIESTKVEPIN